MTCIQTADPRGPSIFNLLGTVEADDDDGDGKLPRDLGEAWGIQVASIKADPISIETFCHA